jgi:hypothetical protein
MEFLMERDGPIIKRDRKSRAYIRRVWMPIYSTSRDDLDIASKFKPLGCINYQNFNRYQSYSSL